MCHRYVLMLWWVAAGSWASDALLTFASCPGTPYLPSRVSFILRCCYPVRLRDADARELRPILLHELTHYRQGDLWVMGPAECADDGFIGSIR